MTVSIITYDDTINALRDAINLCGGFNKLKSNDRVLIKPNNCFRHPITPPYGMVTTTWMIDGVVQLLLEYGCSNISIGEGAIIGIFDELSPYTKYGFKGTGIDKLASKHGVKLIDFNKGQFQKTYLDGISIEIAEAALNTDFLINIPVLKTHFQTKVSLGFKNLKGCLSPDSKKRFHKTNRLDTFICLLNEIIKTDLCIVDGIYMLEKGPETLAGIAHRKNVIIASTDVFHCDIVGSIILGVDPSEVVYLQEYAARNNRMPDVCDIDIKGEQIDDLRENLEWRFDPAEELVIPSGITGLSAPAPGQTLCCACAATLALSLAMLSKDNPNTDFGGTSFYYGLELIPESDTKNNILYGDCAVKKSSKLKYATKITGCPPAMSTTLFKLSNLMLTKPKMIKMLLTRLIKLVGIRLGIYHELFPRWERYNSKEFEQRHFKHR